VSDLSGRSFRYFPEVSDVLRGEHPPEVNRALTERDRQLEDWLTIYGSGGKEYATIVVAANNTHASGKTQADFVCPGTADQTTLKKAVDALPLTSGGKSRGRILLLEGDYVLTGSVDLSTSAFKDTEIIWEGMGGTASRISGNFAGPMFNLHNDNVLHVFQGLYFDGGGNASSAAIWNPRYVFNCQTTAVGTGYDVRTGSTFFLHGGIHGVNATGVLVSNSELNTGVLMSLSDFLFTPGSTATNNSRLIEVTGRRAGIISGVVQTSFPVPTSPSPIVSINGNSGTADAGWLIADNVLGGGTNAVLMTTTYNGAISGNLFMKSKDSQIVYSQGHRQIIVGNRFHGSTAASQYAVEFVSTSTDNLVGPNHFYNNGTAWSAAVRFGPSTSGSVFIPDVSFTQSGLTTVLDQGTNNRTTISSSLPPGAGTSDQGALIFMGSGDSKVVRTTPTGTSPTISETEAQMAMASGSDPRTTTPSTAPATEALVSMMSGRAPQSTTPSTAPTTEAQMAMASSSGTRRITQTNAQLDGDDVPFGHYYMSV